MKDKHPTLGHGKICYLEIPADDINVSSNFYSTVFNWNIRTRSDGKVAFDDGVGEVSGTWVTGRKPLSEPGVLIYIMVDRVSETAKNIVAAGGQITQAIGLDAPEITARFADPAGNIFGLFEE